MSDFIDIITNSIVMIVVMIICFIIATIGAFWMYFSFLKKDNENKFKGFLGWLYNFLNFKTLFLESILRFEYVFSVLFITLASVGILFFTSGVSIGVLLLIFLGILIGGNVVCRLLYESSLVILIICKNTTEINNKNLMYSPTNIVTPTDRDRDANQFQISDMNNQIKAQTEMLRTFNDASRKTNIEHLDLLEDISNQIKRQTEILQNFTNIFQQENALFQQSGKVSKERIEPVEDKTICKNCGQKLKGIEVFCPKCGTKV